MVCCSISSGDEPKRSPLTSHLRTLFSLVEGTPQDDGDVASHPLIIRIHERALLSESGDKVHTTLPVNCVVLGTPATGTSWTSGALRFDTSAAQDTADFLVTLRGQSFSRTVGRNGPARIHSHSDTTFVVTRHVTFSPLHGFRSGRTQIDARTKLTLDEVRSTKPGLRGALVRRIGSRRAAASQQAAEREVAEQVRTQLLNAFDQQLDQRVAELNRQLQAASYAKILFENPDRLSIRVCSAEDCVQIAIGSGDVPDSSALFPSTPAASPIEVWLHQSSMGEPTGRLSDLVSLVSAGARTLPAVQTIGLAAWRSALPEGVNVRTRDDWTILSFDSHPTSDFGTEMKVARRSAN